MDEKKIHFAMVVDCTLALASLWNVWKCNREYLFLLTPLFLFFNV